MITAIHQLLTQLPATGASDIRHFSRPIEVAIGRFQTFTVFAACPAPNGTVHVMDFSENWYPLEDNASDQPIIEAMHRQLEIMVDQNEKEVA